MSTRTIREIREDRGLTVEELARRSGISAKTILMYELRPPLRPQRRTIAGLARALDATPESICVSIGTQKMQPGGGIPGNILISVLNLVDREIQTIQGDLMKLSTYADSHGAGAASRIGEMLGKRLDEMLGVQKCLIDMLP